jgi:hypothetical protein
MAFEREAPCCSRVGPGKKAVGLEGGVLALSRTSKRVPTAVVPFAHRLRNKQGAGNAVKPS